MLSTAKYAKCDQCGNPKVSRPFARAAQGRGPWGGGRLPPADPTGPRGYLAPMGTVLHCLPGCSPPGTGSLAFLCPGQQVRVQPVPRLLQEASFPRDRGLPR